MKSYRTFILLFAFFALCIVFSFSLLSQNENQKILGQWEAEGCSTCKLVFDASGKCYEYYLGTLSETYLFFIEKTSPQCDIVVDEGSLFTYLRMVNINDDDEQYCYEILSLNDTHLQLRLIDLGGSIAYSRIIK